MNGYAIDKYDPARDDFFQAGRIYWDGDKAILVGDVDSLWAEFVAMSNGDEQAAFAAIPRRLAGNTFYNYRTVTEADQIGNDGQGLMRKVA